ncbi:LysM peptidoglycan-binding domain-containing protein [Arthrobacter sp. M4]|uniref:LysM peptidoglycan-binding domain-containing protein n=1 Tax=Arthrobacter sp. M4 TaxID=218160 RepID=UPI001CDCCC2E|nr:hypothetical protein [Arthrobacter sp. M4]MCA4132276.1 hypothetical protein [Arthrobacter sp. M4]
MENEVHHTRSDAGMAVAILLLGAVLLLSGHTMAQQWHGREALASFEELAGVTATTAGLAVVMWWVLSFFAALLAAVLSYRGFDGKAAAVAKFSPAFMRRLAIAVLGLSLVGAPIANAAPSHSIQSRQNPEIGIQDLEDHSRQDRPSHVATPSWSPTKAQQVRLSPQWNATDQKLSASKPNSLAASSESLRLPTNRPNGEESPDPQWQPTPQSQVPGLPGQDAPRTTTATFQSQSDQRDVVVTAGDTLWNIAAEDLGPLATDVEIAREWPRWHDTNRGVIGDDPNLLRPGQVLHAPARLAPSLSY